MLVSLIQVLFFTRDVVEWKFVVKGYLQAFRYSIGVSIYMVDSDI